MIFILLVVNLHMHGVLHKKISPFTLFLQAEVKFEHELIGSNPVND